MNKDDFGKLSEKQKSVVMFEMLLNTNQLVKSVEDNSITAEARITTKINGLNSTVRDMQTDVQQISSQTKQISTKVTKLETELQAIKAEVQSNKEKLNSSITMDSLSQELDDISKRKKNIIIFGLPESDQTTRQERQAQDISEVTKLFEDINPQLVPSLPQGQAKWKIWNRVGARRDGKPRPLLVELDSEADKHHLLTSLSHLKNKPRWRGISITADRTKNQRDHDAKVYQDLKAVRDAKNVSMSEEEKNDFIHVILGRPGDYRVKKVKKRN